MTLTLVRFPLKHTYTHTHTQRSLPCDVHVVNMRSWSASSGDVALLLHRRAFSCGYEEHSVGDNAASCSASGEVVLQDVFAKHNIASVEVRGTGTGTGIVAR